MFPFLELFTIFANEIRYGSTAKILFNINKSKYILDKRLFKKLEASDDIWEFRTLYNGISYRVFAFWDNEEEALVITTHGIIKKSQKITHKDIRKAIEIRNSYFKSKK